MILFMELKRQIDNDRKQISSCQEIEVDSLKNGHQETLWYDGNTLFITTFVSVQ